MKIIDVNCNHCGATLQVDEKTRFVTCGYCHSKLAIQHSNSAIFTEVLERIEEHTGHMSENLELIKLQNELERVDREWTMSREDCMVEGKNGSRYEPSVFGGVFMIAIGFIGFGMTVFAMTQGAPVFILLFGLLFLCVGVFNGFNAMAKSGRLNSSRAMYEDHRRSLVRKIERANGSGVTPPVQRIHRSAGSSPSR